jgi:RNA polymerase sigma-70 factor (ECF subfamily)
LQRALQDLCEEYRTPLVLYYFGHLSYREIAAQLQVPLGTVMSRLARAKGWLRDRLTLAAPTPLATTPPGAAP